jgi:putative sigma-54 modulation protein
MKLIYSGKTKEFTPEIEEKITAKLAKLSKFLEQRGEREAHVTHQVERRLHKVEIIVNFHDHALVGEGVDADLDTASNQAVEKLEKQAVKLRTRWRDTHRGTRAVPPSKANWNGSLAEAENMPATKPAKTKNNGTAVAPKVFRVDYSEDRKPMTLEEAVMEMENDMPYVVYQDSDHNCLSVLIRRPDGNFDLIES